MRRRQSAEIYVHTNSLTLVLYSAFVIINSRTEMESQSLIYSEFIAKVSRHLMVLKIIYVLFYTAGFFANSRRARTECDTAPLSAGAPLFLREKI